MVELNPQGSGHHEETVGSPKDWWGVVLSLQSHEATESGKQLMQMFQKSQQAAPAQRWRGTILEVQTHTHYWTLHASIINMQPTGAGHDKKQSTVQHNCSWNTSHHDFYRAGDWNVFDNENSVQANTKDKISSIKSMWCRAAQKLRLLLSSCCRLGRALWFKDLVGDEVLRVGLKENMARHNQYAFSANALD